MDEFEILSFEDYAKARVRYPNTAKCFIAGCDKPGLYEGGDARFYCGMCEDHSGIKREYESYKKRILHRKRIREIWSK